MSEDRRQILEMLGQGKINAADAEKLLAALDGSGTASAGPVGINSARRPKYLRILVESDAEGSGSSKVNVRVPIQLLRAGVKLAGLIPVQARDKVSEALHEHGVQFDLARLKPEDLDELIDQMNELSVDVNDGKEKVRIFCE